MLPGPLLWGCVCCRSGAVYDLDGDGVATVLGAAAAGGARWAGNALDARWAGNADPNDHPTVRALRGV